MVALTPRRRRDSTQMICSWASGCPSVKRRAYRPIDHDRFAARCHREYPQCCKPTHVDRLEQVGFVPVHVPSIEQFAYFLRLSILHKHSKAVSGTTATMAMQSARGKRLISANPDLSFDGGDELRRIVANAV